MNLSSKNCILMFGGAFDPIHNGHISNVINVEKTLKNYYEDVLVYLIVSQIKHFNEDKKQKAPQMERYLATKEVAWNLGFNYCALVEQTPYIIDTIDWILKGTSDDIILLIGRDQANNFDK